MFHVKKLIQLDSYLKPIPHCIGFKAANDKLWRKKHIKSRFRDRVKIEHMGLGELR